MRSFIHLVSLPCNENATPAVSQTILQAIAQLKEKNGSSNVALKRSIIEKNPDMNFAQHLFRKALKKGVEKGLLIKARCSSLKAICLTISGLQPTSGNLNANKNKIYNNPNFVLCSIAS